MSDEQLASLREAYSTLGGIIIIGLVGILLVLVTLLAWRRHVLRRAEYERKLEKRPTQAEAADLWQAGGKRLTSMVIPIPPEVEQASDADTDESDEAEDDEDDDDDEGKEWWQKSD